MRFHCAFRATATHCFRTACRAPIVAAMACMALEDLCQIREYCSVNGRIDSIISNKLPITRLRSSKGRWCMVATWLLAGLLLGRICVAQTTGSSSLSGVVTDPTGAVVPGATVEIHNPVSQFERSTTTDSAGRFSFANIPFNPYHLTVTAPGFAPYAQDVDVKSAVPLNLKIAVQIAGSAENVTVQGEAERHFGERSDVSHRPRPQPVRQNAAGKHFLGAEFIGNFGFAWSSRRFQRPVSRLGRPRREFVLARWPTYHRSAEQSVLQPDSPRCGAIDDGHRRSTARRVRRQDQPGDRRHHPYRAGIDNSSRQCHRLVWHFWQLRILTRTSRTAARSGGIHCRQWAEYRPVSRSTGVRGPACQGQ